MPNPLHAEGASNRYRYGYEYGGGGRGRYDARIGLEIHRRDNATEGVSGLTREHESSAPALQHVSRNTAAPIVPAVYHPPSTDPHQQVRHEANSGDESPVTTPQQEHLQAIGYTFSPSSATKNSNSSSENKKSCFIKNKKWILLGGAVFVVAIVSASMGVALGSGGDGDDADRMIDNSDASGLEPLLSTRELIRAVDLVLRGSDIPSVKNRYGSIEDWDVSKISDFSQLFDALDRNPAAATFNADISEWDMSAATTTFAMFRSATAFNQDISNWNIGRVRDFSYTFAGAQSFNQDLSSWSVANALTIQSMFESATNFSQDLCSWAEQLPMTTRTTLTFANTACESPNDPLGSAGPFCTICSSSSSSSTTLAPTMTATTTAPTVAPRCFFNSGELLQAVDNYLQDPTGTLTAREYGHPIGFWCVGSIRTFDDLFNVDRNPLAASFNEDISEWDTSSSVSMFSMFLGARQFNQDLSTWDVSRVIDFGLMFANCTRFNADVSEWDTSSAIFMDGMFDSASSFDQDIRGWDVSTVKSFGFMFSNAARFNADLSEWNVGSGTNFVGMFWEARRFTSNLSGWQTSKATDMFGMFLRATAFSSDLSSWQVSRVMDMYAMFLGAELFDSDISSWDVSNVVDMEDMFWQASLFRRNLCPWGSRVDAETIVGTMFEGTSCPVQSDPLLTRSPPGPFCFLC